MEGTDDRDKNGINPIDIVDGSGNGENSRQLDDGDEVTSMATPTLDERDGASGPDMNANINGDDLGDLALTIPLRQTRVLVEETEVDRRGDCERVVGEEGIGVRSCLSPVSNVSLEIVETQSPTSPLLESEKDNFSSFSDSSGVAMTSERKDLEDGEIDVAGGNCKGSSREQGPKQEKKLSSPVSHHKRSRSGEGRRSDLPRYDVRYIIDRKRRNRNRRRSGSLESIGSNGRRRQSRSRSRGQRQLSSPSSPTSPSLPSSPEAAQFYERKKGSVRARSKRRISNSSDSSRGYRYSGDRRRSITPPPRRRKRSSFVESRTTTKGPRRSPAGSQITKRKKRMGTRSESRDSDIVILPKKKSNKVGESFTKKTGKKVRTTPSNSNGTGCNKPKKTKKKAVVGTKRFAVTSATASAAASRNAIVDKEVYAAGNKILVSVNFKHTTAAGKKSSKAKKGSSIVSGAGIGNVSPQNKPDSSSSAAVERAKGKKPSLVIDIMSSPYQVFESSPKETIDIFSEDENTGGNAPSTQKRKKEGMAAVMALVGGDLISRSINGSLNVPTTEQKSSSSITETGENVPLVTSTTPTTVTSTSGAIFPAAPSSAASASMSSVVGGGSNMSLSNFSSSPSLGQMLGDVHVTTIGSAVGANATAGSAFVDASSTTTNTFHRGPMTPPGDEHETLDLAQGPQTPSSDIAPDSYDPFNPTTESPENSNNQLQRPLIAFMKEEDSVAKNHDTSLSVDMEVDSPCSPEGSDLSDFFEPPKTPRKNKNSKRGKAQTITKTRAKSTVQMKLIDDKLKIIDDVPTSAVEMAVKEKFLKKVQRQERIVEEIKMVLKPFYNKKKISKCSYKDIMRKCVPKISHSKNGSINTIKVQKLVNGYVKKYKYMEKRETK